MHWIMLIAAGLFLRLASPLAAAEKPAEYWLLALKEGTIWAVTDYRVKEDRLHYVVREGPERSVPLSDVDMALTGRLNRDRGREFVLPDAAAAQAAQLPSRTSLKGIQKIFIEDMGQDLDQYITAAISKEFKGRVIVVLHRADADAVLRGASTWGRTIWPATVSLVDVNGRVVLWSTSTERTSWWGTWQPDKVAERVVSDLKKAMEQAEKGG